MPKFICRACGVQYAESAAPPTRCVICDDARQYVPRAGQAWTTASEIAAGHFNGFRKVAPDLFGVSTQPHFAIGQRAFLLRTPAGNVLWDCLSLLDDATIEFIRSLGGLKAVALSHPHFYSAMARWGEAFNCPVLAHDADRDWVVDPAPCIEFWRGDSRAVLPGVTLHRLGGHFPGSSILHWEDRRIVLPGDTVLVTPDRRHVSLMWSYPNYVPLPADDVRRIGARLAALDFDAIHSAFWDRGDLVDDAKAAVARSVARHIAGPGCATL